LIVYIDDIMIVTETIDNIEILREVFITLKRYDIF